MLEQAAGFAFLGAISPVALFIASAYLASGNPRQTVLFYLVGAAAMTIVLAVVVLVVLHAGGFNHPHNRQPRYGLRLGLGVIALGAAAFVARRKPKPAKPGQQDKQSLVWRMVSRPGPASAFIVGVIVFGPSVNLIAAMQAVATAKESAIATVLTTVLVVVITVMFIWLALVFHLVAPEQTTRALRAAEAWLHAHGRALGVGVLVIAGIALVVNGSVGLA